MIFLYTEYNLSNFTRKKKSDLKGLKLELSHQITIVAPFILKLCVSILKTIGRT